MVIIWSCGRDEVLLNISVNDLWYFSALLFFFGENFVRSNDSPFTFMKICLENVLRY